jgi:cation:H+ antiporter
MQPVDALWTFPVIVGAAILISWAAESAQYRISQGLALAILALVQTLPEYSIEAVISWRAGKDPSQIPLMTANFTGALRLLIGLGWPLIFVIATTSHRFKRGRWLKAIKLKPEHSWEVLALILPCLYLIFVVLKGTLNLVDALFLVLLYLAYLWMVGRIPPEIMEEVGQLERVPRFILTRSPKATVALILTLFAAGAGLLFFFAEPFLESVIALAAVAGVSTFFMVQWIAPLLSEFPEKISAFHWARKIDTAPLALMNMASSAINEATLLVALMPVVFFLSTGGALGITLDAHQRIEILLTLTAGLMGAAILADGKMVWWEALFLFLFWLTGFVGPMLVGTKSEIWTLWLHGGLSLVQLLWAALVVVLALFGLRRLVLIDQIRKDIRYKR